MSLEYSISPERIRAWRGARPRSAVAHLLGVTPLTVYRWELPEGSAEARRPRGAVAGRLHLLLAGAPAPPPVHEAVGVTERAEAALEEGHFAAAETALLRAQLDGELRQPADQALAAALLARIRVYARGDVAAAVSLLAPWLDPGELASVPPRVRRALALSEALACSQPVGGLFDPRRVRARLTLARESGPLSSDERVSAAIAEAGIAYHLGGVPDGGPLPPPDLGPVRPLSAALLLELAAHAAVFAGNPTRAMRSLADAVAAYDALGLDFLAARAQTWYGLRLLDDAQAPAAARTAAESARARFDKAGAVPGHTHLLLCKVEGEASVRLGRFAEGEAALRAGLVHADHSRWTPYPIVPALGRLLLYRGRNAEAVALAQHARTLDCPVHHEALRCGTLLLEALAVLLGTGDGSAALALVEQALPAVETAPVFAQREALTMACSVCVRAGDDETATALAARLDRVIERFPSTWHGAMLRRQRGHLALRAGRIPEAIREFETARAGFAVAGDVPEGLISRRFLAEAQAMAGEPGAQERLDACAAEFTALGMTRPAVVRERPGRPHRPQPVVAAPGPFDAPVERLALRGMDAAQIGRELLDVARGLAPGVGVRLDADPTDSGAAPGPRFEFGDGSGRRWVLAFDRPLDDGARGAVRVLVQVAALAMEVALLRGYAGVPEPPNAEDGELVIASAAMRQLDRELARLGGSRATVLLTGESGAGKEVVARVIHARSARARAPYITFNCATVPRDLFEGQLFGYRRGAFTGANADNPGVVRAADGGTLFLDEVAELPLDVQPKLLRFLENGEIHPLGERRPVQVDVRVIAATNRDLGRDVAQGRFREDLYYRLHVVPLHVPPLRERPEDILALARHFLRLHTPAGAATPVLGSDAVAALRAWHWPGNVRELRNVIERVMAFAPVPAVIPGTLLGLPAFPAMVG